MATQDIVQQRPTDELGFPERDRTTWVRLRTLIVLRWVAILGQAAAVTVAERSLELQLQTGLCYMVIGVSVIGNLIAMFVFPRNTRLSEIQNFMMVLFDLLQLGFLLFLTGGLHNPFSLLLLGPVTISASVLTLRLFLVIAAVAILIATLLANFYFPLQDSFGQEFEVPYIFLFGHWVALVIAVVFFGAYTRRVTDEMHGMSDALTATQLALSREQKLTDLGGVVAAAAHELGTPLATIKLTSSELMEELDDKPDLKEDAALIREQADRCRDILRDMGRAGKDDVHLKQAPLSTVLEEAAEPHSMRGIMIDYDYGPLGDSDATQPSILRLPEIIHGLRNLVQNAVDFADYQIWVKAEWSETKIKIRISDDGPGYPSQVIDRIGDPMLRRSPKSSSNTSDQRVGYEGMGLGLFIAKTLLERTGAHLVFANGTDNLSETPYDKNERGAIVEVNWPRELIDGKEGRFSVEHKENQPILR